MNTFKYLSVIILFSILLFSGCRKVLEFDEKDIQSLLVLNCVANPDSTVTIDLTRSASALEELVVFPPVKDASITLNDGTNTYSDFEYITTYDSLINYDDSGSISYVKYENGYYINRQVKFEINKEYTIEIKADGFDEIKATTEVPYPVSVEKIDTFSVKTQQDSYTYIQEKAKIYFTDPVDQNNFYRLKGEMASLNITVDSENGNTQTYPSYSQLDIDSDDPVFGTDSDGGLFSSGSNNTYSTFNDQLFNGKSYSIEMIYATNYSTDDIADDGSTNTSNSYTYQIFKIELLSLSESYYTYLNTLALQSSSESDPFSDPVLVYTNIENGTGIFGSWSTSDSYLVISDFNEEMLSLLPYHDNASLFNYIKSTYSKLNSGSYNY